MATKSVITISRQYGSGGHEIGKRISKELRIPLFDRECMIRAIKESDNGGNAISKSPAADQNFVKKDNIENGMTLDDRIFHLQSEFIKNAAKAGPCVIVGCCANYILRDESNLFSVYIYADPFFRMDRIVKVSDGNGDVKLDEVAQRLVKNDRQRANYYHLYTNENWDDLRNYHLAVNSAFLGIDSVAELIIQTLEKKEIRLAVGSSETNRQALL